MTAGSDTFADATLLGSVQNFATHDLGPSATAGTEPGEPLGADTPDPIDRTRWVRFVPAVDGRFGTVGLLGDGSWRKVSLYRGDGTLSGLVPMGTFWTYWGGTTTSFRGQILTAGQTYWLQVGTEVGDVDTDYQLFLTFERKARAYGEWIQGDDFVREVGYVFTDQILPGSRVNRYGTYGSGEIPGAFDADAYRSAQRDALIRDSETHIEAHEGSRSRLMNVYYDYDEVGGIDTEYRAWSEAIGWYFSAWDKRATPNPVMPLGATGIEWEGGSNAATVVGGTLKATTERWSWDQSTGDNGPVMNGEWQTLVWALPPGGVTWQPPASGSFAEQDYLAYHDMADEHGTLAFRFGPERTAEVDRVSESLSANVSAALDEYGHLALLECIEKAKFIPPLPEVKTYTQGMSLSFGTLISGPSVDMVMHPPRHRFYTETWETYLGSSAAQRQWPGDNDGHRLGGGLRVWPRPRTLQATGRRAGGFR